MVELDLCRLDVGVTGCDEGTVDKLVWQTDLLVEVGVVC